MAIQNQVSAEVIIGAESTFGTSPAAGLVTAKKLRRVTTSLALGKDIFQSAEARPDQQIADMRHGTKRPGGGLEGELCNVAYDDLLEALMRGTWAAGVSTLAAAYTTIAAAVVTGNPGDPGSTGTLTWAAGDPIALGYRIGDIVRLVGAGFGANVGKNFRIISFANASNRTITVTPSPTAVAANAGTSIAVQGNKLVNGTVKRSFTVEQSYPDVDVTELFTGMRVGSGAIRLPPNGMSTIGFGFMGQNMTVLDSANAPYFTSPVAQGTNGIFAGPNGSLRANGIEQGIVTALDINIDVGLSADPVVGRVTVPEIFYGPSQIGGSVSAFLQDRTMMDAFVNETEVDIVAQLIAAMPQPEDFICFNLQRVKLGGATKTVAAQGGVIVTYPWTGLLATAGSGKDATTLTIQRSN